MNCFSFQGLYLNVIYFYTYNYLYIYFDDSKYSGGGILALEYVNSFLPVFFFCPFTLKQILMVTMTRTGTVPTAMDMVSTHLDPLWLCILMDYTTIPDFNWFITQLIQVIEFSTKLDGVYFMNSITFEEICIKHDIQS